MNTSPWWQRGIVYQVYPLSFQDANADGKGDLQGIRSRLAHLEWLGVDAIWISPIYCGIAPEFGSMEDFDGLVADAHRRGIRVILDFVPNHTSDRHPWFEQSRASRASPKRDWYIWRGQPRVPAGAAGSQLAQCRCAARDA